MNEPQPLTKESILNQEYDDQDWPENVIKLNDVLSAIKGLKSVYVQDIVDEKKNCSKCGVYTQQHYWGKKGDSVCQECWVNKWFPIDSQSQSTDQTKTVGYLQDTDKVDGSEQTSTSQSLQGLAVGDASPIIVKTNDSNPVSLNKDKRQGDAREQNGTYNRIEVIGHGREYVYSRKGMTNNVFSTQEPCPHGRTNYRICADCMKWKNAGDER